MSLITIVVPIYNTEKYLHKCLDSIISQSYKNLDIVLIDDGSTDNSSEICQEYLSKDNRIRYLYQENKGQGSARNRGIEIAQGEYIAFVDSDDWIENNMYEKLYENILKYSADISCCENISSSSNGRYTKLSEDVLILNNLSAMQYHIKMKGGLGHSPVDKLYRLSLFKNVKFIELKGFEDAGTIIKVFSNANLVVYQPIPLYHYNQHQDSTMNRRFSFYDFDRILAYEEMEKTIINDNRYIDLVDTVITHKLGAIFYVTGEACNNDFRLYSEMINRIRLKCKGIKTKKLSLKYKLLVYLIRYNARLYGLVYKIFKHNSILMNSRIQK